MYKRKLADSIKAIAEKHPELKKNAYSDNPHPLAGLCYVTSEALFHAGGGQDQWRIRRIKHEGCQHWFLQDRATDEIYDLTVEQFKTLPNYVNSISNGFLTKEPSKRTKVILKELGAE